MTLSYNIFLKDTNIEIGSSANSALFLQSLPNTEPIVIKKAIDTFITGLVNDGVWESIDGGNILALGTIDNSFVDFKKPSRIANTNSGPTHTFLSYRGFTGSGNMVSQRDYINTNYTPSLNAISWTQNSAHIAIMSMTSGQEDRIDIGSNGTTDFFIRLRTTANTTTGPVNGTAQPILAPSTNGAGFFIINRTDNSNVSTYKDGTLLNSNTNITSTGIPNAEVRYLQVPGQPGSSRQITFSCYGGGLSNSQISNLTSRVQTLLGTVLTYTP